MKKWEKEREIKSRRNTDRNDLIKLNTMFRRVSLPSTLTYHRDGTNQALRLRNPSRRLQRGRISEPSFLHIHIYNIYLWCNYYCFMSIYANTHWTHLFMSIRSRSPFQFIAVPSNSPIDNSYIHDLLVIFCFLLQKLLLADNGEIFNLWKSPPVNLYIKIYLFNITNVDAFLRGEEKMHVEEVGPYVYR